MTLDELRASDTILLDAISGSHAYGLATATSDVDRKGVFCQPRAALYGLSRVEQIADERNDEVYYELGRFVELAERNNPNILELLATPEEHVLRRHPAMLRLSPKLFLSRRCEQTFGRYAWSQIKKARGLKKKVVNPMPEERRTLLEFCHVLVGAGTAPLVDWLGERGLTQAQCGLAKVPNARGIYALYVDPAGALGYGGVVSGPAANAVRLSSIPKGEPLAGYLHVHADGYSQHCRAHREYWDWVDKRNDARYTANVEQDRGYDAKNMMHVFRLLDMATEILRDGELHVARPNRAELLETRSGAFAYEELLARAEARMRAVETVAKTSPLPEVPDAGEIERVLVGVRDEVYAGRIVG